MTCSHLIAAALLALTPQAATQRAAELDAPVRLEADGEPIDSGQYIAHSGPLFADYDGDGIRELLVGNFKGHLQLYRNVGTATAPKFEAKGLLQAAGKDISIHNW